MIVTAIIIVLFVLLAVAVIAGVVSVSNPEGGIVDWLRDSYRAWKQKDLDTADYRVMVRNARVDTIFATFDDATKEEEMLSENVSQLPGARLVRETSDEVYDAAVRGAKVVSEKTRDMRQKAAERAQSKDDVRPSPRAASHVRDPRHNSKIA